MFRKHTGQGTPSSRTVCVSRHDCAEAEMLVKPRVFEDSPLMCSLVCAEAEMLVKPSVFASATEVTKLPVWRRVFVKETGQSMIDWLVSQGYAQEAADSDFEFRSGTSKEGSLNSTVQITGPGECLGEESRHSSVFLGSASLLSFAHVTWGMVQVLCGDNGDVMFMLEA